MKMHKEVREVVAFAATHGFEPVKMTGSGHIKLQHPDGHVVFMASTPGKYTWRRNAVATIRRLAQSTAPVPAGPPSQRGKACS